MYYQHVSDAFRLPENNVTMKYDAIMIIIPIIIHCKIAEFVSCFQAFDSVRRQFPLPLSGCPEHIIDISFIQLPEKLQTT